MRNLIYIYIEPTRSQKGWRVYRLDRYMSTNTAWRIFKIKRVVTTVPERG